MSNYFHTKNIAERYEKGRPYFHADIISEIKEKLGLSTKLNQALDVACGTGLSSRALLEIASHVDATDISEEMLNMAYPNKNITYTKASAEEKLFSADTFDIITVSSGVHWFNIDAFLAEANRILKSDKYLVIYDSYFAGTATAAEAFNQWYLQTYQYKFPAPKRNNTYDWSNQHLKIKYFELIDEQKLSYDIEFTSDELVLYLTTQSNITAQVEQGLLSYEMVEAWLQKELHSFFDTAKKTFRFSAWIKYLKKIDKQ